MSKYVFSYKGQVIHKANDILEIDALVDKWLDDNFSVLNEYSNYLLDKENYEEYAIDFKNKYVEEVL